MSDHNAELHQTEPEIYRLACPPGFRFHVFGEKRYDVGFCVNSPGGGGFTDDKMVWINDDVSNPEHFIEYCIHEGLHAAFPKLTEYEVGKGAQQIAEFLVKALKAKRVKLPTLKPYADAEMRKKYFPECVAPHAGEEAPKQ